jgi:diacylglycerol O-acyltransferase
MPRREKMSAVDTAWLHMDRPTNLMMILGVMVFAERMDFTRLRSTVEARLVHRYRRFRQCAVEEVGGAFWQDDPDFDIDAHLRRRALPGSSGKAALQALAGELAVQPLNSGKPLWRFDLIEDYEGGSAMVVRIHHSIADGIALVGVVLSLTDQSPHAPPQKPPPSFSGDEDESDLPSRGLLETLAEALGSAFHTGSDLGSKALTLAQDPDRLQTYGHYGIGLLAELAKLLAMPPDSPTRLKGHTGTVKRVAWAEPMPLGEVKALGRALGCSINDVLLSAVAGAFRAYLQQKGESVDGVEVRAMVPVNLRSAGDEGTLGNRFGLVTLSLPLWEANPFARLFLVRERMNELKHSFQPPLTLGVLAAVGLAPKLVQLSFPRHAGGQGQRGDDQRAGTERAALPCRRTRGSMHVLGAAVGRHRRRRLDPQLQRRGAVQPDQRPPFHPRPRDRHAAVRRRVRKNAAGAADAGMGPADRSDPGRGKALRPPHHRRFCDAQTGTAQSDAKVICHSRRVPQGNFLPGVTGGVRRGYRLRQETNLPRQPPRGGYRSASASKPYSSSSSAFASSTSSLSMASTGVTAAAFS